MSLLASLSASVGHVFSEMGLDPDLGHVVVSARPELGQFQCNGALAAAKAVGRPPRELAQEIADRLKADPRLGLVEVAGPGFINLSVTDQVLADEAGSMAAHSNLGLEPGRERVVLVDYAGPNVAKAMHVGHLRATIIGDSLARLFRQLGHEVIRDPHFGDWGLQMGQVIAAIEEKWPDLPYFEGNGPFPSESPVTLEDLQELYPASSTRAASDPEWAEKVRQITVDLQQGHPGYFALWQHMKRVSEESQRKDFARLGVEFDLWYGESDVAERLGPLVDDLRARGLAIESRGAWVMPLGEPDDKRDLPPLILETTAGAYLYATTDLATIAYRVEELGVDLALYVVDARQSDHFELLFRGARKAGIAPASRGAGTHPFRDHERPVRQALQDQSRRNRRVSAI